jgi:uracil-DNA glycosylase family 4
VSREHATFAALVAALRGALSWHLETGDSALPVPHGFKMPLLGQTPFSGHGSPENPSIQVHDHQADKLVIETVEKKTETVLKPNSAPEVSTPDTGAKRRLVFSEPVKPCWQVIPIDVNVGGSEMAQKAGALHTLKEKIGVCTLCPLHQGRSEIVFGHGHPGARIMFIADGPSGAEDGIGVPFVGEPGLLLGRMIRAMGLKRSDTYLTYLTRCYSPAGEPELGLESCASFLATEIQIVQPEVIVALGELAARRLTGHTGAFPQLRGKWFDYEGIPVLPTFHPQALLQHPQSKSLVWTDLKAVMRHLGLKTQDKS